MVVPYFLLNYVAGSKGFRTYRRACLAASRFEPHSAGALGTLDGEAFLPIRTGCIDPLVSAFRGISRSILKSLLRESSTTVMRRSLAREKAVGRRRGVRPLPGGE